MMHTRALTRGVNQVGGLMMEGLYERGRDLVRLYPDVEFLILVGPSGVGKGTAVEEFLRLNPEYHLPVSVTTRAPRPGEVDGKHYHFRSEAALAELIEAGKILTGDGYVGNYYADFWPDRGEKRILLEVTLDAALLVKRLFPKQTTIFFFHPTGTTEEAWRAFLTERLNGRNTEDPATIARRVDRGIQEIETFHRTQGVIPIYNADTVNSVQTIIAMLEQLESRK